MSTVTVRGEGGAVFDMDIPVEGTVRREAFDDAIAKGRLVVLDEPAEPKRSRKAKAEKPDPNPEPDEPAEGSEDDPESKPEGEQPAEGGEG